MSTDSRGEYSSKPLIRRGMYRHPERDSSRP